MIFVASPLNSKSPDLVLLRISQATAYEAHLDATGQTPHYVAVAHAGRHLAEHPSAPLNYHAWTHVNDPYVRECTALHALKLYGWHDSQGMAHEIALAGKLGKPVIWIEWPSMQAASGENDNGD